jgi:predicted CoA-binding protein
MGKYAGIETGTYSASTREILQKYRKIAMVGLSPDTSRPSYRAAVHMKSQGYKLFPVNPNYEEILGFKCYKSLKDIPEPVDIVDIFRKPEDVPPIVEEAIAIGAKVIWMQLGIVHEEAAKRAREAGLDVVMDRCVKMEHTRFWGGLNLVGLNTGVITSKKM